MEFLTDLVTTVPACTSEEIVNETKVREAQRSAELASAGHLLRLWRPPAVAGEWRTLGLYRAESQAELEGLLATMPLHAWMTVGITPLTPHPSDPQTPH